ncbi:MAG: hypothetical protein D6674_05545 [Acidobacteria bacterium]|nr:MAG: hypothetical protein D6674_05545 [Acidobacteriota bacterium]
MQTCTTPVSDSNNDGNITSELQNALTTAQSNNQNDVICIQAGTYTVTSTLTYSTPNGDNGHTTTIKAVGGQVVLNGGDNVRIMSISTDGNAQTSDAKAQNLLEQHSKRRWKRWG